MAVDFDRDRFTVPVKKDDDSNYFSLLFVPDWLLGFTGLFFCKRNL